MKIGRIKAEIESRSKDVNKSRKADLIRRIKIAQVTAKKRKKRMKINAWAKIHVTKQRAESRKASRAKDKEENRADPKGNRYMPNLEGQSGSSVTYDSDSDDSIPEVNWDQYPRRPQRPTVQETTVQETATNLEAVGSLDGAIGLRKSIRNRIKSTEWKEGCPSYRDTF